MGFNNFTDSIDSGAYIHDPKSTFHNGASFNYAFNRLDQVTDPICTDSLGIYSHKKSKLSVKSL